MDNCRSSLDPRPFSLARSPSGKTEFIDIDMPECSACRGIPDQGDGFMAAIRNVATELRTPGEGLQRIAEGNPPPARFLCGGLP
ncbi:MAG: hypothetical protein M9895_03710 [Aquamicrobium sp.]|uniref:hypothetical protein n=1 Tax=Aquamicrobium sp. TaxID=1872579 RepID=UPI00349EBF23|nr:hypothetical protein [Aquamicrobium sp.]